MRHRTAHLIHVGLLLELSGGLAIASPPDPFADQYHPPVPTELGTTAGQLRLIGSGGARESDGLQLHGQATLELMTFAISGIRLSTCASSSSDAPGELAWKIGPSLHFLPYRRVDLTVFFEAGPAYIAPFSSDSQWSPSLGAGIAVDVALSTYWFAHVEGSLEWTRYERDQGLESALAPGVLVGVGVGL